MHSRFGATLALGTLGYCVYQSQPGAPISPLTARYPPPSFEHPVNWMLETARWFAALFTVGAVYQVGRRLWRDEIRTWRVRRQAGHLVAWDELSDEVRAYDRERRPALAVEDVRSRAVVVRGPNEDRRHPAGAVGAIDVGRQGDAVAHRHPHVELHRDGGVGRNLDRQARGSQEDGQHREAFLVGYRYPARTRAPRIRGTARSTALNAARCPSPSS